MKNEIRLSRAIDSILMDSPFSEEAKIARDVYIKHDV